MTYSFSDFGGIKVDYDEIENPTTDRTADEVNKAFASIASSCSVTPDYIVVLTCVDTDDNLQVSFLRSQYPNLSVDDITLTGPDDGGDFVIHLPHTVVTNMGETKTTSIQFASVNSNYDYDGYYQIIELTTTTNTISLQNKILEDSGNYQVFSTNDYFKPGVQLIIQIWTT